MSTTATIKLLGTQSYPCGHHFAAFGDMEKAALSSGEPVPRKCRTCKSKYQARAVLSGVSAKTGDTVLRVSWEGA